MDMSLKNVEQPDIVDIEENLRLRDIDKSEWKKALSWYHNPKVMYYSEGLTDNSYNIEEINRMYSYLSRIGELYFIEIFEDGEWTAIGDVTLSEKNMPIVVGDEKYWGRGIGKKVISKLIKRAKYIKLKKITIEIYDYNERSQNLFKFFGFKRVDDSDKGCIYELSL